MRKAPDTPANADATPIAPEPRRQESLPGDAETTAAPMRLRPGPAGDAIFARLLDVTDDPGVRSFLRRMLAVPSTAVDAYPIVRDTDAN